MHSKQKQIFGVMLFYSLAAILTGLLAGNLNESLQGFWTILSSPAQLTMDYFKEEKSPLHPALKWLLTNQAENFLTMPDFVSYRYCDCKTFSNTLARRFWGIQGVTWTLKTQEEFDEAVKDGWLPIFEGFKP